MKPELDALEARIVELEIRYTHQEAMVETLSDVVREQHGLIERLERRLEAVHALMAGDGGGADAGPDFS